MGCFDLYFIIANMDNLDVNLGGYYIIFYNGISGQFRWKPRGYFM